MELWKIDVISCKFRKVLYYLDTLVSKRKKGDRAKKEEKTSYQWLDYDAT